jgi:hypothetical protein
MTSWPTPTKASFGLLALGLLSGMAGAAAAQAAGSEQQVAALKQAAAANQASLRQYVWVQHTSMSYKGDEKSTKDEQVRYDAEGKLAKVPLAATVPDKKKGVRGKIAESKGNEMKEYMESVIKLVEQYVPPVPAKIQEASKAGKMMVGTDAAGLTRMEFRNYVVAGDVMTLTFDMQAHQIRRIEVNSALEKDPVTLAVVFQNLPDGTNYAALTTVNAVAKEIVVTVANRNHVKAAQ